MFDMDDLLNCKEAAAVAHVRPQLICYWVSKGYLTEAGKRGKRSVYRRGDVLDVERRMRSSNMSNRGWLRRGIQRVAV